MNRIAGFSAFLSPPALQPIGCRRGEPTGKRHPIASNRFARIVLVLIPVVLGQGCYSYRVQAPKPDPATEYQQKTVSGLFWGLYPIDKTTVAAADCKSNAIDEVEARTNMGFILVSVATLGVWSPMNLRWRCAKASSAPGRL
jgi:Bor protein